MNAFHTCETFFVDGAGGGTSPVWTPRPLSHCGRCTEAAAFVYIDCIRKRVRNTRPKGTTQQTPNCDSITILVTPRFDYHTRLNTTPLYVCGVRQQAVHRFVTPRFYHTPPARVWVWAVAVSFITSPFFTPHTRLLPPHQNFLTRAT